MLGDERGRRGVCVENGKKDNHHLLILLFDIVIIIFHNM